METQGSQQGKKLLYEVSYIRPIVIFLLVVSHSFTEIHKGAGTETQPFELAEAYLWLVRLIKGFRIETIALVAGYVFAYQSLVLGRKYPFWPFMVKKFKRLIVPMLIFGVVYYFCFLSRQSDFHFASFVVTLLSGCGHLWFLPMLFWCFIAIWVIDRFKLSSWITLVVLALISVVPNSGLPLGFNRLPHFLFYVFAGYFLWEHREVPTRWSKSTRIIAMSWIVYIALVVLKSTFVLSYAKSMPLLYKGLIQSFNNSMLLFSSCCGILALYITVIHFTNREGFIPPRWVINASSDCYGVYVYHQFILVWLYFYTPLVGTCPPLLVPIIGLILALSTSLLLTRLSLKTRLGRFLIG